MVYDTLEVCSYLKMANVFTSEIYIKNHDNYVLLDEIGIAKVDSENNFFFLNSDLDSDPSQIKVFFRVKLESSIIEFSTTILPSSEDDEKAQKFVLPKQMMIQYIRSELRVVPSKKYPIETKFSINRLSLKLRLLDISTGGMAVIVSNVELLLEIGDVIDEMEILLTEQEHISVKGQVRFLKADKCCIKFVDISPKAERRIAQYIERRKLVDVVREKLFLDVEEKVMKFVEDESDEKRISNIES